MLVTIMLWSVLLLVLYVKFTSSNLQELGGMKDAMILIWMESGYKALSGPLGEVIITHWGSLSLDYQDRPPKPA